MKIIRGEILGRKKHTPQIYIISCARLPQNYNKPPEHLGIICIEE